MNTQRKPMFPRLRLLMMLFMLVSMLAPLGLTASAAPADASSAAGTLFQSAEQCHDLDTSGDLHLDAEELEAVDEEQRDAVREFCSDLPSQVLTVDAERAQEENSDPDLQESDSIGILSQHDSFGLCHATGSETNQYVYISPDDQSYDMHLANHFGPGGGDRFATEAEFNAGECFNDSVVTFVKYFCTVNAVEAPAPTIGDPTTGDCVEATAEQLADVDLTLTVGGTTYTTEDLLAGIRLAPGEYDLYEGETLVGTITIEVTGTTLTFNVLNYIAAPTFEVDVDKYFCTVNALEAPAPEIRTPGEGDDCELATDQEFTLSIDGQTFTTADLLAGVQLAPGEYDLYEGETFVGTIVVVDIDQTVNVLNYIAAPTFEVDVDKYFCIVNQLTAPDPEIGDPTTGGCELATDQEFTLSIDGQTFTTADLLAGVQLAPGEYDLYEGETFVGTIVVVNIDQTVNVLNYVAVPDEGEVELIKYVCVTSDGELVGTAVLATDQDLTDCTAVTSGYDFDILDADDNSLLAEDDDLLAGPVSIVVGEGYQIVENGHVITTFDLTTDGASFTVINYVAPDEGQIAVFKTLCETIGQQDTCNGRDDLLAGYMVDFNIFAGEGTDGELVETVTVTLGENAGGGGNTGAGSQGRIVSGDLPLGTYTVCEVEVAYNDEGDEVPLQAFPRPTASQGGSTGGSNQEQFGEDCILVELTPGVAELKFLDLVVEEEPGLGKVIKYFCTDEDITVPVVGDDESSFEGCEPATAEQLAGVNFWVYPFGDADAAIDVDDSALFGDGVVLPLGTHTLVEEFNGVIHEMADLTIVAGETTTIMVFNPIEMERTVDLNIYKAVCEDVDEADEEDPCVPSDALDSQTLYFTVYALVGEDDDDELEVIDYVETSLVIDGNLGSAVVNGLPEADFYAVCEAVPTGIEGVYIYSIPGGATFEDDELGACIVIAGDDVTGDNLIEVLFLNDVEEGKPPVKPEKPVTPEKPVIPAPQQPAAPVTKLPSTGSGTADDGLVAPWMLMASAAMLAGTGAILRKERPAA